MRVSKKSIIVSLIACLVLFLGLALGFLDTGARKAMAAETVATRYSYKQLTDGQIEFYAAVQSDASERTDKTVILSGTNGGSVYANIDGRKSDLFILSDGDTRTVIIKANNSYVIESVTLNGTPVEITNTSTMELEIAYDALTEPQAMLEVNFVAADEENRGDSNADQQLKAAIISVAKKVSASVGGTLEIRADVTAYGDTNTYQWYKDGEPVADQTSSVFVVENAEETDAGQYSLKVTSFSGSATAVAESDLIEVRINNNSALALAAKIVLITAGGLIVVGFVAVIIVAVLRKTKKKSANNAPQS